MSNHLPLGLLVEVKFKGAPNYPGRVGRIVGYDNGGATWQPSYRVALNEGGIFNYNYSEVWPVNALEALTLEAI